MTNKLLTQIVRKNKMYVVWKTTPVTSAEHEEINYDFKIIGSTYPGALEHMSSRYL